MTESIFQVCLIFWLKNKTNYHQVLLQHYYSRLFFLIFVQTFLHVHKFLNNVDFLNKKTLLFAWVGQISPADKSF